LFVNDRTEIGTYPCRLSGLLYRVEAEVLFGNGAGQPHTQAVLSGRENVGFVASLKCSDTHYPKGEG